MLIRIPQVLTPQQVQACRQALDAAQWADGKLTAGGLTKIRKNKFSDDQVGSTDEVVFKGKRKGKKVTGTIKVTDKLSSTVSCGPTTVKFSAKRV